VKWQRALVLGAAIAPGALPAAAAHAAKPVAPPMLQRLVTALGGRATDAASPRYAPLRKLDGHLQGLEADRLERRAAPSLTTSGLSVAGGRVLVDVYVSGDLASAAAQLRAHGMDVREVSHHAPQRMVEGWLPVDRASEVAGLGATRAIVAVAGFGVDTGGTLSQGDAKQHGPQARALGPTGTGVPVGIISDSINKVGGGVAGSQSTGDLPSSVQVLQDGPGGSEDEGRAMAEIVYDEAPGIPSILFSTGAGGPAQKVASIDALVAHGAKVIADDTFYIGEPFFQDDAIVQAVNQAKAAGVAYLASAGNRARQSWEGTFTPAADGVSNNFNPGGAEDKVQSVSTVLAGGSRFLELQWDEPWGAASSTFELDVYSDGALLGSFTNAAGIPSIFFSYNAGSSSHVLGIGIKRIAGSGTPHFKYIAGGTATFTVSEHDTSSPAIDPDAASATGGLTVAAVDQAQVGLNVPEPFSSRGPVTRLFDAAGNRLPAPEVRAKPELAAADDVSTSVSATFNPFFGTSAAAPSAAGVAALLRSAKPSMSVDELYAIMTQPANAIDCVSAAGDPDSDCGAGFIQADRMVPQALDATPPAIAGATAPGAPGASGWFTSAVTVSWSATDAQSPVTGQTGCEAATISDGTHTLTCSAASAGGTASSSLTVKVDTSPPSAPHVVGLSAKRYAASRLPRRSAIRCRASDPTSGVTSCKISHFSASSGRHVLSATATNGAGLTSSSTLRYTVKPTISSGKAPRRIPLAALLSGGLPVRLHVSERRTRLVLELTVTVRSHGRKRTLVLGRLVRTAGRGTTTLRLQLGRSGRALLARLHGGATLRLVVVGTLRATSTALGGTVKATG
jgi:Subtilase family